MQKLVEVDEIFLFQSESIQCHLVIFLVYHHESKEWGGGKWEGRGGVMRQKNWSSWSNDSIGGREREGGWQEPRWGRNVKISRCTNFPACEVEGEILVKNLILALCNKPMQQFSHIGAQPKGMQMSFWCVSRVNMNFGTFPVNMDFGAFQ